MTFCKKYRLGFDIWALVLFLSVMIPTIIWTFVPAPNDILRAESTTPVLDIAACLIRKGVHKVYKSHIPIVYRGKTNDWMCRIAAQAHF